MPRKTVSVVVDLSEEDRSLQVRLAEYLGVPNVVILRWAIRYYVLEAPWALSVAEREAILQGLRPLDCGPQRRGVVR